MNRRREIEVVADWEGLPEPMLVGRLTATPARGREVFAFAYDPAWLSSRHGRSLDPELQLYVGAHYPPKGREQFGIFLDSAPDRWGRLLMKRREAWLARSTMRAERALIESDYLLGVHDEHRIGALRFRIDDRFLDDNVELAAPPWTSLRELQAASLALESERAEDQDDYGHWIRMLVSPGGSLGGARPKASVRDEKGVPWIAKFPSRFDDHDVGAWEKIVHSLAQSVGVMTAEARMERFGRRSSNPRGHRTFLVRRFDRTALGRRIHFASAMTLLGRADGDDGSAGASYLDLAEVLALHGSRPDEDLEQLWRRIVFAMCVSNVDDHLRNHGFLLDAQGWRLAPAFDLNADPHGNGLTLNVSESDNAQDFDLALSVAPFFRLATARARDVLEEVRDGLRAWRATAEMHGITRGECDSMQRAFRLVTS